MKKHIAFILIAAIAVVAGYGYYEANWFKESEIDEPLCKKIIVDTDDNVLDNTAVEIIDIYHGNKIIFAAYCMDTGNDTKTTGYITFEKSGDRYVFEQQSNYMSDSGIEGVSYVYIPAEGYFYVSMNTDFLGIELTRTFLSGEVQKEQILVDKNPSLVVKTDITAQIEYLIR